VVAPTHGRDALAVSGLATAPPVLGTPALGIVKPATVRQRRRTRRANEGAVVLAPEEIEGDLVDDMIELNWFGEWDRHDRVLVTRRIMAVVRDAIAKRRR
jgi:hypothetical protein